ncbi:MAG: Ig-like domain-containing protein [Candidatus Methanomethyliales bacterium]|nr:Ig-like domain-containing protein [Candidatus Methanomethylicales archaeon]
MFSRKFYLLIAMMLFIPFTNASYASPLTITTDKQTYYPGDVIYISGTTEPNSDITIQLFNPSGTMVDIDYKVSSANGYYSMSFKIPLKIPYGSWTYGTYTVRAYSVGQIKNTTFILSAITDTTPPTITSFSPGEGSTVSVLNPIISVLYSDDVAIDFSTVKIVLDGTDVTSTATITSTRADYIPVTDLSEGPHTVYFEVKDLSGNKASKTWNFTVSLPDFLPPIISSVYPSDGSILNLSTITINATYSDNKAVDPYSVTLKLNDSAVNMSSITPTSLTASVNLTDGVYLATLSLMDTSGNMAIMNWTFTIDATPPTISGNILNNNTVFQSKEVNFTIFISDNIALNMSSLSMTIDGTPVTPTMNATSVTYSGTLSEGSHSVVVSVRDIAGNLASKAFTFSIAPPTDYMIYIIVVVIVAVIAVAIIFVLKRV